MSNAFADHPVRSSAASGSQAQTQAQQVPIGFGAVAPDPAVASPGGSGTPASPVSNLAQGIGGILLFPGRMIVQQFVGTGDPLDTSHLPITVLLSAAVWYGAYWYFFKHGQIHHKGRNAE